MRIIAGQWHPFTFLEYLARPILSPLVFFCGFIWIIVQIMFHLLVVFQRLAFHGSCLRMKVERLGGFSWVLSYWNACACEIYMIDRQLQLPQPERIKVCCLSFSVLSSLHCFSLFIWGHCPVLNFVVVPIKWLAIIRLIVVCLQLEQFEGISVAQVGA